MTGAMTTERRRRRSSSCVSRWPALMAARALPLAASAAAFTISRDPVVSGVNIADPDHQAGDGTNRLFVVEQRGTIRVIQGGALLPGFFLDIRSKVGGRRRARTPRPGVPSATSRRTDCLYVFYTRNGGDIVVSRFRTNAARTDADREHRATAPADRAQRPGEPQRRGAGVRPDRRLPVHRRRRRRRERGSEQRRPEEGQRSSARSCGSTWTARAAAGSTTTRRRGAIPSTARRRSWRRSGHTGCAIRGGSRSTVGPASSSSPMSGRARWEEIDRQKAGIRGGRNYGWNAMEGMHCYTASEVPAGRRHAAERRVLA